MPLPREHILAKAQPPKIDPVDRLYEMAVDIVNSTDNAMSQMIWLHHLSTTLVIPKWQSAILWKRLENEQKLKFVRKFVYDDCYIAAHKQSLNEFITTLEQYNYKFVVVSGY
jgi:hypothetical protein